MQYGPDFSNNQIVRVFIAKLFRLLTGAGEDDVIPEEVWRQTCLVDRVKLRNEWAGIYQSLDSYRALGFMHDATEAAMLERVCGEDPLKKLFAEFMVQLRDQEGFELEWWTYNHLFYDVLDQVELDWACRLIPRD